MSAFFAGMDFGRTPDASNIASCSVSDLTGWTFSFLIDFYDIFLRFASLSLLDIQIALAALPILIIKLIMGQPNEGEHPEVAYNEL